MADAQKRVGLIGLSANGSWASRAHLPYFQRSKHYTIAALQNSSQQSAEKAASKYDLASAATYGDSTDLAHDSNVNIVAVSVNVPGHYDAIVPALKAKKDVFVEWPLARNLKEAEELTSLAREAGVRTMVGLQARLDPSIIKAKQLLESGEIGTVLASNLHAHGAIFGPKMDKGSQYLLDIDNGANLLTIPFGHAVDALCYVLGEFSEVKATLSNMRPEIEITSGEDTKSEMVKKTSHDQVAMIGTLERGGGLVNVLYQGGISVANKNFYWEIVGTKATLLLEGGHGHVQMFQPTLKMAKVQEDGKIDYTKIGGGPELEEVEVEKVGIDFSYNVGRAWDDWATSDKKVTTFEDALLRHKMIDAVYRSHEKGTSEKYL